MALVLSVSLAAPAPAGPFEDAEAAYKVRDYATALRLLRPLADQGDAAAQSNLGLMYALGQGVPQDYAEAVKWYGKAAEQGNARAQNLLGVMHAHGSGVPQDHGEAARWYRRAAEQGFAAPPEQPRTYVRQGPKRARQPPRRRASPAPPRSDSEGGYFARRGAELETGNTRCRDA